MNTRKNDDHLRVDDVGLQDCEPAHQYGPAVRGYHLIHYVFSGKGEFYSGGQRYKLHAGQGFAIFPGMVATYRADTSDPWSYGWMGFSGKEARALMHQAGITPENPVFSAENPEEIRAIIRSVREDIASLRMGTVSAVGGLLRFIAHIAQFSGEEAALSPADSHFEKAVWYIEGHLERGVTVSDVADFVGLCRSQLFRVFRSAAGVSPQEWILTLRLNRAAQFLVDSSLTLEEIARSCGFSCAAQLGQAFRKHRGISPTELRRSRPDRVYELQQEE